MLVNIDSGVLFLKSIAVINLTKRGYDQKIDDNEPDSYLLQIRALSNEATGGEAFMTPGFAMRDIQYYVFTFENGKLFKMRQ